MPRPAPVTMMTRSCTPCSVIASSRSRRVHLVDSRFQLGFDHAAELTQALDLVVVEHPRAVVHDAERADALPVGHDSGTPA